MSDSHLLSKTVIQNVSADLSNTNLDNLTSTGESHFQAPLVSGDNIKTINSNSLLGSGDLVITSVPVGTVLVFAGSTAPTGYLLCDGSAVSRTTYSALFSVIGTTYGVGDGSSTFNLPNFPTIVTSVSNNVPVKGNGKALGMTNGSGNYSFRGGQSALVLNSNVYNATLPINPSSGDAYGLGGLGVTTDASKSGIVADLSSATNTFLGKICIKY